MGMNISLRYLPTSCLSHLMSSDDKDMNSHIKGPIFNVPKRKWEAPSASSFVGGSMSMSLVYRRKNDSCAQRKSKKVGLK